jgi:hypothetical protein
MMQAAKLWHQRAALLQRCVEDGQLTLDTNVYVVLLALLDLAGIFIRFRERVESLEVLDGHTRAVEGFGYVRLGCERARSWCESRVGENRGFVGCIVSVSVGECKAGWEQKRWGAKCAAGSGAGPR